MLVATALAAIALVVASYVLSVFAGMRAHARVAGVITGLHLHAPVAILRDGRGVPHIVAKNDDDLFFAQGYVEGSDRLFQMDLWRRYAFGELAEIFGRSLLAKDEARRAIPVRAIVTAQWQRLDASNRRILERFADGVNAAMAREPLPVEFRLLAYRPSSWTAQDSLAVAMAQPLNLVDDWNGVALRDAAYRRGGLPFLNARFPLTDPCYDAPVLAGLQHIAPGPNCRRQLAALLRQLRDNRPPSGSNAWVVGANRTAQHRALLANDPHLPLTIPGVWYLIDLHSPGYHVAGATLPGLPGVVLGHNERLAWGATDGFATALSVFSPPPHLDRSGWQNERFSVRFGLSASKRFYRTKQLFGLSTDDGRFVLVRWKAYEHPVSPVPTILKLDRATSIESATAALASLPGASLNFVLADTTGRASYVLAGQIPNDPAQGRWIHPARDLLRDYPMIPFAALPKVAPARDAVVWSANNKMYGAGFPLELSPQFEPPYRAYRIAQLLRARRIYDAAYFARMQLDVLSLPERELARDLAPALGPKKARTAFARWNGEMAGDSTTATVMADLRWQLTDGDYRRMPTLLAAGITGDIIRAVAIRPSPPPWRVAGALGVRHPLNLGFLNGTTLPGSGDWYTVHLQVPEGLAQTFRAVWDIGNWDAGGISLPQGESGEPGSGHYTDEAQDWIAGRLLPLPFSDRAVRQSTVSRLTLQP